MARGVLIVCLALASTVGAQSQAQDWSKEPVRIPDNWIDLPESPFVAYMLDGKAILVNRSARGFYHVSIGCVAVDEPRVRVDHELFATSVSHGAYGPGSYVDGLLHMINIIGFYENVTDAKRCRAGTRPAVTGARDRDGFEWSAQGTIARDELLGDHAPNGVIFGMARDSLGGVIPGVTVTATSNGRSRTATTNSRGEFALLSLERGTYRISGVLAGFRTVSCDAVTVGTAVAHCDLRLSTGGPPIPRTDPRYQALEAAESRWRASGINSYQYGVSIACFCTIDQRPMAVRVVDGNPEPSTDDDRWRRSAAESYNTVEKLFAKVRAAFDRGDEIVDATYDAATGRPLTISLDMSKKGEDDDVYIVVSGFKIIAR